MHPPRDFVIIICFDLLMVISKDGKSLSIDLDFYYQQLFDQLL